MVGNDEVTTQPQGGIYSKTSIIYRIFGHVATLAVGVGNSVTMRALYSSPYQPRKVMRSSTRSRGTAQYSRGERRHRAEIIYKAF